MQAYTAALEAPSVMPAVKPARGGVGTFDALAAMYYASTEYFALSPKTRHVYKLVIERLYRDEKLGHRLVKQMQREHVQKIMTRRAETPGAANDVLKKLKVLMNFAILNGFRKDDPTLKMKKFSEGSFHTWTDGEVELFRLRWELGTTERLAFELLLCTGQRLADIAQLGWADVGKDSISLSQGKTKAFLVIPIHPKLREALRFAKRAPGPIIRNEFGRGFSDKGFGNWMAKKIELAGLDERCVTHGIRKGASRLLAECGCTTKEIMAITGHKTMKEVVRYTDAADQKRLAESAILKATKHM
jgi:integrase